MTSVYFRKYRSGSVGDNGLVSKQFSKTQPTENFDEHYMQTVIRAAPFVFACLIGLMWMAVQLNPLSVGEEWAASRGVDVRRVKRLSYFIGSILTGAVTSFCGPIGFVGLIIPHAVRLVAGPDHRVLVPASFFLGSAFLVVCDTAARTLFAPVEIPVGIITALLGGPFFILLLKRKHGDLW